MQATIYNNDCLKLMKIYPTGYFDLAIVDPPYGINFSGYERYGYKGKEHLTGRYAKETWDTSIPTQEYFDELFRVSKNQIIWGGNYFPLPPTQCFVFWYKQNPVPNFSDGEYAWTSFKKPAKCFDYRYYGNHSGKTIAEKRTHPTEKPIELYRWLLREFANEGDKILDTHLGSMSSVIASIIEGYDITGYEISEDYYKTGKQRIEKYLSQLDMFREQPIINFK